MKKTQFMVSFIPKKLSPEQRRLVEETHKHFVRAGVQLDKNL
jgi:Zn-dependent oligopeptidase